MTPVLANCTYAHALGSTSPTITVNPTPLTTALMHLTSPLIFVVTLTPFTLLLFIFILIILSVYLWVYSTVFLYICKQFFKIS